MAVSRLRGGLGCLLPVARQATRDAAEYLTATLPSASCFVVGEPRRPSLDGDAIHRLVVLSNSHSRPPSPSLFFLAVSFSRPQDRGPRAGGFDAGLWPQGGPAEPVLFSSMWHFFFFV